MTYRIASALVIAAGLTSACTGMRASEEATVGTDSSAAIETTVDYPAITSAAHYSCDGAAGSLTAQFLEEDQQVEVTMPAVSEDPVILTCSSTRVGPECESDGIWTRFDIITDTAQVRTDAGLDAACTLAVPD